MKTKQFKINYHDGYEYVPMPFDEKNLCTDWLEEFFFDYNVATNKDWNQLCGYGYIEGEQYLCEVTYEKNVARWNFIHMSYLDEHDVKWFVNALTDYMKDSEGLAFTITFTLINDHDNLNDNYESEIKVVFEGKVE